jgi:hypothetical protein
MIFSTFKNNQEISENYMQYNLSLPLNQLNINNNNIHFNYLNKLNIIFTNLCIDICQACFNMSTLPQGALFVRKLRENHFCEDGFISRMKTFHDQQESEMEINKSENQKWLGYNPLKYNEKLMNSIWGQYNRYSPHNIKTNVHEEDVQGGFLQQPLAVAAFTIAENLAMAFRSGKEWCFGEEK